MSESEQAFRTLPGWCGFEADNGRIVVTNSRDVTVDLATRYEPFAIYRLAPADPAAWFWCVTHQQAEHMDDTAGHTRVGPYFTESEAIEWGQR